MKLTEMIDYSVADGLAILTVDNPPVNALSRGVRDGLNEGLLKAEADGAVKGVLILCKGRTFIAGADIKEFGKPKAGVSLQDLQKQMEKSSKPVIAALHGTALGGGLETALCAHYRIAAAGTRFGLPEVNLGILPGAGGTQRLPRIVGVERALDMMVSGEPMGTEEALNSGLIDEVTTGDLADAARAYAAKIIASGAPLQKITDRDEKLAEARGRPEIFTAFRKKIARKTRGFKAPEAIVQCVEACLEKPFEEAIRFERERFQELVDGDQSGAQRYAFFAERGVNKIPDVPKDTDKIPVKKVGVIGAGTMGGGIAMNFANVGIPVTMVEVKDEALQRGLGVVRKNYERSASRGRFSMAEAEKRMGLIEGTLDFERLKDCDLVIEAVFENMDIKKDVFQRLDRIAKSGAILATNSSALDINEIASVTSRPEMVIGLHFFSPANVMQLLEIVRGAKTSKSVIATSMALAKTINKVGVLVGVCPGFVGNRMLYQRRAQAQNMLHMGALPWDVDRVLFDFGFPMGPFAMSDLAGLDIGWSAETSKGATIKDQLCEMGRRGQKTGAGYYTYDPETRQAKPEPAVEKLIRDFNEKAGYSTRSLADDEILKRMLLPMVNEGAKILEEGMALRAADIDVVWLKGYGWPVYRGGPMYWADQQGLKNIVADMKKLQEIDGGDAFWEPSPLLVRLAESGKSFTGE